MARFFMEPVHYQTGFPRPKGPTVAKKSVVETVVTTKRTVDAPPVAAADAEAGAPREPDDFDLDVERIIGEIGHSGSRCRVTRLDETRQQMVGLATVDAAQISEEFMQREFGGGTYKIRFRNSAGAWGRQITIVIDRRIPAKVPGWLLGNGEPGTPSAPPRSAAAAATPSSDSEDEDDEKMFKRMYRMRFLDLIEQGDKLRARQDEQALRSSEMTMNMMKTMMESISASAASMRAAPSGPAAMSFADILKMQADTRREAMELVKELRGGNTEANTIDKTLATMNKLREQSSAFFGDDAGDSGGGGFASLLLELGKALAPALAGLLGQKLPDAAPAPAVATTTPARPALAAAPPPAADPAHPETVVPETPLWLTFAKASLLDAAQEGRDPQSYAISVLELVPRPMHGQIREAVMREDAAALILERVPELGQYQVWLAHCIDAFRLEFNPPVEGAQG